jgi:hypothetical protein
MTRALLVAVAAIATVSFAAPTAAESYGARVIGAPDSLVNQCVWNYTFVNDSSSEDYSIWLVQIDVDPGIYVMGASAPTGWTADFEQPNPDHFVTWTCNSPELEVKDQLQGFQAVFDTRPTYQGWSAQISNSKDPDAILSDSGVVTTVEPGACTALLTGLIGVTAFAMRRHRR